MKKLNKLQLELISHVNYEMDNFYVLLVCTKSCIFQNIMQRKSGFSP